jgi:hypothetical protein
MRFGTWRGVAPVVAFALAAVIATGVVATTKVQAGLIVHTIPREVVAVDVNTGGEYFAPPVPNGFYAKDPLGAIAKACGLVKGLLHGCCPGCCGSGCDLCGGTGKCGHCNLCMGSGDPCGEVAQCCGFGGWRSLLHGCSKSGVPCGGSICSPQAPIKTCSFVGKASTICPSVQAPMPIVSPQAICPSPQSICGKSGCLLKKRHFHRMGNGCSACNGMGCGICHGGGLGHCVDPCSACGGKGCGICHGGGLGHCGDPCSACGGKGCGLCCGAGGKLCGLLAKLFHVGDIEYFVGPGGPVPITPGYVPYVVTTRSPRDYFAFPPFSDVDP